MKQIELCSQLACMAYNEPEEIHEQLGLMGMEDFEFINNRKTDTQVFCCRKDNKVYISFRGTESLNLEDWVTNLECGLVEIAPEIYVHEGFDKDVKSVMKKLRVWLHFQAEEQKIEIYIMGHSQGAGDAGIFGLRLLLLGGYNIKMVVPVAAPRYLSKHTANFVRTLYGPFVHRIVNNNDVVTRVPTRTMGYAHPENANFYYIMESGEIVRQISQWELFKDRIRGRIGDLFELGTDGLKDHDCMEGYLKQIRAFNNG